MNRIFKIVFQNQSNESAQEYKLVRETSHHYFFELKKGGCHTYRLSKQTLKFKGIKYGEIDGYSFDIPKPKYYFEIKH